MAVYIEYGGQVSANDQRVLLVDDDLTILTILEWGLKDYFMLLTARDPHQAIVLAQEHVLHAVVSDYMMPGKNGHWVLEELAREQPTCRRVLMSSGVVPAAKAGVVQRFFAKPVDMQGLIAHLQKTV